MFSVLCLTLWVKKVSYFFFQSLLSAERATGGTLTDRLMKELFTHHLLLHCTFYWDFPFQAENSVQCKTEKRHSFVSAEPCGTLEASLAARPLQRAAIKESLKTVYGLHKIWVCLDLHLTDDNFISYIYCTFLSSLAEVFAQTRSERTLANWKYFKFSDIISLILVHCKSAA